MSVIAVNTGRCTIKYVDYIVARTFKVAIDEWYRSLKKNNLSLFFRLIQRRSHYIPFAFRFLTVFMILSVTIFNAAKIVPMQSDVHRLFFGVIVAFGAISLGAMLAEKLGEICERAVDTRQAMSGLRLNRGDQRAFEEYRKSNRNSLLKMIGSLIAAIAVNVVSSVIAIALGIGS